MKHLSLTLALCLLLTICSGCGAAPAETTTMPPVPTTTVPVETTTAPPETTVPPTEPPEVIDFSLDLPEGFAPTVISDYVHVYSSPNAPMDTSCITVEVLPMDESVLTLDREEFLDRVMKPISLVPEETVPETTAPETTMPETTLPETTGDGEETTAPAETTQPTEPEETEPAGPQDVIFYSMAQVEVDGWPALFSDYTLVYSGYSSHIYRYEVVVNYKNYVFTFADDTTDNLWLDQYEELDETIDLILDTEGIELDYSGLEHYKLDCGMQLFAEPGMEPHKAEGFSACLGSKNVIILMMSDNKEANNLTGMTMEEYAGLLRQTNDLGSFKWDSYGNYATTFYSVDEAGIEYYNMICLKESDDSFWVCQMACSASDQVDYARAFSLWATSISAQ